MTKYKVIILQNNRYQTIEKNIEADSVNFSGKRINFFDIENKLMHSFPEKRTYFYKIDDAPVSTTPEPKPVQMK